VQKRDVDRLISVTCYIGAGVDRHSASPASRDMGREICEAGGFLRVPWWLFPSQGGRALLPCHNSKDRNTSWPNYYAPFVLEKSKQIETASFRYYPNSVDCVFSNFHRHVVLFPPPPSSLRQCLDEGIPNSIVLIHSEL